MPNARLTPGGVRAIDLATFLATEVDTEAGRPGAAEKRAAWDEYGYPGKSDGQHWEYDHLVPIECGGDNDLKNIWPEPRVGPWNAWDKDRLEDACGKDIRNGSMTVAQAQAIFLAPADWRVGYRSVFGSVPADALKF